jgi:hypothetical protein
MNVITKFLEQYSYRFPKGYPDMNSKNDQMLLSSILEEIGVNLPSRTINEGTGLYDETIKSALKADTIPAVQGNYSLGSSINLSGIDKEIWTKLYPISPPKSKKEVGTAGSKGTGNGEIALYWLFEHQSGHTAMGTQGGDNPDLNIDGKGVEVKAYGQRKVVLGKFGSDKVNIELLNTLFGLDALVTSLENKEVSKKVITPTSFNEDGLINAFNTLKDFSSSDLRNLSDKYSLIGNIYSKVDGLLQSLNLESSFDSKDGATLLLKKILLVKLEKKPGFGGYMADVTEDGRISFTKVEKEDIENSSNENILNNIEINQGAINIIPSGLFKN